MADNNEHMRLYSEWNRHLFADCSIVDLGSYEMVYVSGMGSEDKTTGNPWHIGDLEAQTMFAFERIRTILLRANCSLEHIVRLTAYLTDIRKKSSYEAVQQTFFDRDRMPVHTLICVTDLAWPGMEVEIEATALRIK